MAKTPLHPDAPSITPDVAISLFDSVSHGYSFEEFLNHDVIIEELADEMRQHRIAFPLKDVLSELSRLRRNKDGLTESTHRVKHDPVPADLREQIEQVTVEFRNVHSQRTVELLLIDPTTRQEFDNRLRGVGVMSDMLPSARRIAQNLTKNKARHNDAVNAVQVATSTAMHTRSPSRTRTPKEDALDTLADKLQAFAKNNPAASDEVRRILRELRARDGQSLFRMDLLTAYDGTCVVSACTVMAALQAAHIEPFNGLSTNHVTNGLLLRADLHALFDADLLGINPTTNEVRLHPEILAEGNYQDLDRSMIRAPVLVHAVPAYDALEKRWELFLARSKNRLKY